MFVSGISDLNGAIKQSISVMNQILSELKEIKVILKENSDAVHPS